MSLLEAQLFLLVNQAFKPHKFYQTMATTMRLLVSHHPPAPNFFQQHAASLFSCLHMINIVLQNLVLKKPITQADALTCL